MRSFRLLTVLAAVLMVTTLLTSVTVVWASPTTPAQCDPGKNCPPPAQGALIAITKTASPTSLPAGGGNVTYTYVVTNGGSVPLTSVTVSDNKCAPVTFVGGDANANGMLDISETWTYTCTTFVTVTTTNVATAVGTAASGIGTSATATATVSVACPPTVANCTPPPTCPPGTVPCPTATGTLCVTKFNDLNGDGVWQATEPTLANARFTITPAVPPASQLSPATGKVCWTVPAGSYSITESGTLTTGAWVPTTPTSAPSTTQTVSVAAGATVNLRFGDHRFTIDHFACYTVSPTGLKAPFTGIGLLDQFGRRSTSAVSRFTLCNPAQKTFQGTVTKVLNPNAHLVCYRPSPNQTSVPPALSTVQTVDQFGNDVLQVVKPIELCLPSSKSLTDKFLPVPTTLDHYQCYSVKDLTPHAYGPVGLVDEFGRMSASVLAPFAICAPVQKTYKGRTTKVLNPIDHLVCYTIESQAAARPVWIANQFEKTPLKTVRPVELCVPALKRVLKSPFSG